MIATYIAAAVIFLLAVTGMAVGTILGRRQLQCSCKGTLRVMGEELFDPCPNTTSCSRRMVDDTQLIQNPAGMPETDSSH